MRDFRGRAQGQVDSKKAGELLKRFGKRLRVMKGKCGVHCWRSSTFPVKRLDFHEEAVGIHLSLAAAVDAYITARELGHPIVTLIVGKAISGAFLAHGLQASEILALHDERIEIHVMSEASVRE